MNAQKCEIYDRSLFNMLPEKFPEIINCVDEFGLKQGAWIQYKVSFNSYDFPDELARGRYVEKYSYGYYQDNYKLGVWEEVFNVHLIWVSRRDSFYFDEDSNHIKVNIFGEHKKPIETTKYNSDSTIISYSCLTAREKFSTEIICNTNLELDTSCVLMYRGNKIRNFSWSNFELEKEKIKVTYFDVHIKQEIDFSLYSEEDK
jgi:hypothetical protein